MKRIFVLFVFLFVLISVSWAQESVNKKISVVGSEDKISIIYLPTNQTIASIDAKVKNVETSSTVNVNYSMITGKRKDCQNAYNQAVYSLSNGKKLLVRVFNDGVAFSGVNNIRINFSSCQNNWLMKWVDSYEEFFPKNRVTKSGDRWGYPALFEYQNNLWALISESNVNRNNALASLYSTDNQNVFDIKADGQEDAPWQTIIIGSLADVVESTLITDNSEPCVLDDCKWIEPGVASWIYWANNHGSNDYNIIKKYVDMAVELKLPYVLIDAEWDEMKDGKTVEDAVNYAISQKIKPMIWYNSSVGWINGAPGPKFRLNKPEDREKEFAWCEKIGVKGVKIDFFSGDNNLNVSYMIDLLESAAKHHLLVNFHGATIPRGWQRTYPNLISTEGVYGAEWYNNVPTFTNKAASHNAMLPFTRNVVGPMDYTPCAFSDSQHPHITSLAHELALTVLYESGIVHLADSPESLLSQPKEVRDFFGMLPTAWDETKYVCGYPGESVVLARRKGKTWFVAGINGSDNAIEIDLGDFFAKFNKKATIFWDNQAGKIKSFSNGKIVTTIKSSQSSEKWAISKCKSDIKTIPLKERGGFVMVIK